MFGEFSRRDSFISTGHLYCFGQACWFVAQPAGALRSWEAVNKHVRQTSCVFVLREQGLCVASLKTSVQTIAYRRWTRPPCFRRTLHGLWERDTTLAFLVQMSQLNAKKLRLSEVKQQRNECNLERTDADAFVMRRSQAKLDLGQAIILRLVAMEFAQLHSLSLHFRWHQLEASHSVCAMRLSSYAFLLLQCLTHICLFVSKAKVHLGQPTTSLTADLLSPESLLTQ